MKERRRKFTIASAIAVSVVAFLLLTDDTPRVTEDVLADDSSLALEVMTAQGDSVALIEEPVETALADRNGEPLPPEPVLTPAPLALPPSVAAVVVSAERPGGAQETLAPSVVVALAPMAKPLDPGLAVADRPRVALVSMNRRRTVSEPERNEPPRRAGTVSAGSELSVVAGERICTNDASVGDTFSAVLANAVSGSNGLVIPRGAQAVAQIASTDKWGAGLGVRVKSVRFGGRTHQVTSDVGYVTVERSSRKGEVCIPRRGRIDTALRQPLRVGVSSPDA